MAGAAERAFPAAPVAYGGNRVIASPFQFATTDDDNLQIVSANSLAGVVLTVQGRRLSTKGEIEAFSYSHTPNTDRTTKTENYKLGGGALLNLVIFASSGAPLIGQTYVSARIIRGLSAATLILGGLLGGYVTGAQPLAYPGSPIYSAIEGGGAIRLITGTDPAAGAEFLEIVPTGARWELLAIAANLVTNATVADRRPGVVYEDGANTYFRSPQTQTIPAGSSVLSHWAQNSAFNPSIRADVPIAELPKGAFLLAGQHIRSATNSLQAGDNYGAPLLVVREWLEVQS